MTTTAPLLTMELRYEQDVVTSRQRTRQIAEMLGFDAQDQTRIATAVSEITRNAFRYATGGKAEFLWDSRSQKLIIKVSDSGPGIQHLQTVLGGNYQSSTGMGLGILGARRLADGFCIESEVGRGTTVKIEKQLPSRHSGDAIPDISRIASVLTQQPSPSAFDEVEQQNQELIRALETVQSRESELTELNRELRETNRGVVALYAELDEKAIALQSASEMKSRFLANMSHEFRTPVSSILSLTWLLLDKTDGPISAEQEKQITLIRHSAQSLVELINDLLDLAKIESGKIDVRVKNFELSDLFSGLRGMFKPMLSGSITLTIEDIYECAMQTDEGKVSQIMRNLISNAIKFTPAGNVRVKTRLVGDNVVITVKDSGIGIPQEHLSLIFEEFHQVKGAHQDKISGTGLGLPLSRRLATLLGATLTVESEMGIGSTFTLSLPRVYTGDISPDLSAHMPREQVRILHG